MLHPILERHSIILLLNLRKLQPRDIKWLPGDHEKMTEMNRNPGLLDPSVSSFEFYPSFNATKVERLQI